MSCRTPRAAILGLLAAMLAFAGQAQETSGEPASKRPAIGVTGLGSTLTQGEGRPLSQQAAQKPAIGYEEQYLRVLERIDGLPEALRAEIARDPHAFNLRSKKLVAQIGLTGSVTAGDVRRYSQRETAQARAAALARHLALDLNGDGTLAKDEIDYATWTAPAANRTEIREIAKAADGDRDGAVTYGELVAAIDRETVARS